MILLGATPITAGPAGGQVVVQGGTQCGVEDTTVTLSALNAYTAAAVGGRHVYRVNGGPVTGVADAGTFTASPGDVIQVLWANGTSTMANRNRRTKKVMGYRPHNQFALPKPILDQLGLTTKAGQTNFLKLKILAIRKDAKYN